MPLPTHISRVAINAVLDLLFPLLLTAAGGSQEAACQAALAMLARYNPNSAEELGLAAEIIAFRNRALACTRAATRAGLPPGEVKDLDKMAAALRRSETAAQRKLDALQRARRAAAKQAAVKPQAQAAPPQPQAEAAAVAPAHTTPLQARQAAPPAPEQTPEAAVAAPAQSPNRMGATLQRLASGKTPDQRALTARIADAFRAGDHQSVLNAVIGTTSAAVSAAALLHTA